jgi:hypothetical protein
MDEACAREAASDRFGVLDLEPLLWRAPPRSAASLVFARDLGPEGNERVRAAVGGSAWIFIPGSDEAAPSLIPYADGMALLWGGSTPPAPTGD